MSTIFSSKDPVSTAEQRRLLERDFYNRLESIIRYKQAKNPYEIHLNEILIWNVAHSVCKLAEGLKNGFCITKIELSGNSLKCKEVEILASALRTLRSLHYLDLSKNEIKDRGTQSVASILETNYSITYLDISQNKIGLDGHLSIANSLKKNETLTTLLSYNSEPLLQIKNAEEESTEQSKSNAYAEALKVNFSLTKLKFRDRVLPWGEPLIEKLIERNCKLSYENFVHFTVNIANKHNQGASLLAVLTDTKDTLLHQFTWGNETERVRYLVRLYQERGLFIDTIKNEQGKTPLDMAFNNKHSEIFQILLENSLFDHSSTVDLPAPIQSSSASRPQSKDNVEISAERQEEWEAALALTKAKRAKYRECEKKFQELGLKLIDRETKKEESHEVEELYKTAKKELEKAQQDLLEAEENAQKLSNELEASKGEVRTLLLEKKRLEERLVEINRLEEIYKMTREGHLGIALFASIAQNDKEAVEHILDQGYPINNRSDGSTALHEAVEIGSEEIVKLLLDKKADPNKKNSNHETSLHRAVKLFNQPVINLLLNAGADVTIPMEIDRNTIAVDIFMEQQIEQLKRELAPYQKELATGLPSADPLKAKEKKLEEYNAIYSKLSQVAANQDKQVNYYKAERLIEWELANLGRKYNEAIKKHPEMIRSHLVLIDLDKEKIIKQLDAISLLKINEKKFKERIEEFFENWKSELEKK